MKITGIGQEKIHDYDDERSATIWNRSVTIQTQSKSPTIVGGRLAITRTGAIFHRKMRINSPVSEATEANINGPQGHLTNVGTTSYAYVSDLEKRPATTTMNTATSAYVYDAPHLHIVMTVNRAVVQALAVVVHEPLVLITPTQKYDHANHLYSVAALTNQAGGVVERYRYSAYGERTVLAPDGVTTRAASSYNQQVGFTGRYLDKETGLWFFRGRYYSGSLGRFIGRDPIEYDGGGMGLYGAYFIPNSVDPYGEVAFIPALVVGAIGLAEAAALIAAREVARRAALALAAAYLTCCTLTEAATTAADMVSRTLDAYSNAALAAGAFGAADNNKWAASADAAATAADALSTFADFLDKFQSLGCPIPDALKGYDSASQRKRADDLRMEARGRRNIEVKHPTRKEAKEAAEHPNPGKKLPQPPKDDKEKMKAFEEQGKYKNPESHPDSNHPDPHFHDRNKSDQDVNRHHTFPR